MKNSAKETFKLYGILLAAWLIIISLFFASIYLSGWLINSVFFSSQEFDVLRNIVSGTAAIAIFGVLVLLAGLIWEFVK